MILLMNMFFFMIMIFSGILMFISNRKHLLVMLLSLEFMELILFLMMFMILMMLNYELYFKKLFLTLMVWEGALGLSILVSMIRTHGNNYFQSFNILLC
uniref:NADH-ubiquinone oxidoreductase chain 4L n=1 Tax=Arachnocampa flava TaxID=270899 RepID=G8J8G0_9DIPT